MEADAMADANANANNNLSDEMDASTITEDEDTAEKSNHHGVDGALPAASTTKKTWRRQRSLEDMARAIVQDEVRADDTHPLEFTGIVHDDVPTTDSTATPVVPIHDPPKAVEDTAFGLPQVDMESSTHGNRKSSLQMIGAAAAELRDMHRMSSHNLDDPVAKARVAARRELWRTVGFFVLFLDALYVLICAPLRLGFFYDPWDQYAKRTWTRSLTIFSIFDGVGEVARIVFVVRIAFQRRMICSSKNTGLKATVSPANGEQQTPSAFASPTRKSLFSTRGSVSTSARSMKPSEALFAVVRTSVGRARQSDIQLAVLLIGALPLELIIAIVNYNWLHAVRVSKLLTVSFSLVPSYSAILLKCRRFQWAQWLSFSTLALPFYLFWLGLYLCHLAACGYMLIANVTCGLDSQYCVKTPIPGSWVLKDSMERATLWRRYVRTMYWASKTITTLGQGDLVPATLAETNYCVVVQYISGLWATAFLASCSFYFSRRDRDIEKGTSTRLEQALRFLSSRKVPSTLALQIRNYYQHIQRTRNGIEEDHVLSNLPAHYRSQCSFFVKYRLLAKIPFFSKQPKAFLRSIVDKMENDFLPPKQTILALFDPVELIIVSRGDVGILDQNKTCIGIVTQHEWFGEETLFEDSRSRFELEAKTSCEILRLSHEHFQACMEKHFPRLKIAAMVAQQKRRAAMIPSTDARLQHAGSSRVVGEGRTSGRSTIFLILQQALGNADNNSDIPWQHPESNFRRVWRRWKAVMLLFVAVEVPFEIAFEWRVGYFDKAANTQHRAMCILVVLVEVFFYVDWFFRAFVFARECGRSNAKREESVRDVTSRSMREDLMSTASALNAQDRMVTKPDELWKMYLFGNSLWFDIAVNVPISVVWTFANHSSYSIILREFVRCARLLAFGRLVILKHTLKKIMVEHDFSPASQLLTNVVVFCVTTANAMACYFYLLADDKDFYNALPIGFNPDVTPVGFNECLEIATLTSNCTWFMFDRSKFSIEARYIRSLHWSLVLLSTVGYGDILSFSDSECLIGFWWIFFGALICYFTSCAVGSVVTQITVLRSAQDARVEDITRALVRTNVSPEMRLMIRSHYETNWEMNGSALSEKSMMQHLPRSLRRQLSASLYVEAIRRCYVFTCLGGQAAMLREIAMLVSSEMFLPKVTITENGHLASALYVVLSGDVELLLPFESSRRIAPPVRRRSLLDGGASFQNPFYRFYLRLKCFGSHHCTDSTSSYHAHRHLKQHSLGIPIAALKEGDCFGEEGLLPDHRSALRVSARTLTGTQLAILTRDAFMSLAGRFPVQVRQVVTLITKKQDADTALYDTIRGNVGSRSKALEIMGMSASLYCETKRHVNNIITTDTYRYRAWHVIHAVVIMYNFYAITFRLAFLSTPTKQTMLVLTAVDYIMDSFLYADVYLKWNRFGYQQYGDQIVDLGLIRRRYKKGWFRVDCWSLLPLYYFGDFFLMSLARLPRLLKSLQLFENIDAVETLIREKFMKGSSTMLSVFDLFKFLLYFLSAAHQVGSIYYLLGRLLTEYKLATSSWITVDAVINAYPGDIMVQYNRAIYWCLETFTVVCFGDVIAQNASETVYAFCTCIVGWMCIGQVVGRITSLMANIDKDMTDHNARVDNFEKYAQEKALPEFLRERAIESAEYKSKCLIELNVRTTFEDLPPALHAMLFEEMYGFYVRQVPEFAQVMKASQLRVLADALTTHIYVTDDIIFEEGRLGSTLYIMKEGRAEYFSPSAMIVFAAIYEGQLFGDTTFFVPHARHLSSARARRSCQVLELERRTWNGIWDEQSRQALEGEFAELAQQKLASTMLAYTNIARNFDATQDGMLRNEANALQSDAALRAYPPALEDSKPPNIFKPTTHTSLLTQYRSSLHGYTTLFSLIKSILCAPVTRKVAPVLNYQPMRCWSSRKTIISSHGRRSHKLRRNLGINTAGAIKYISPSADPQPATENSSAYVQRLETIKSRFRRRQERAMFNLHQFAATSESVETTSEIWVDPPLPPSFCLENSKFRRVWNTMMYFVCLYFVLVVPFRVSFDYEFLSSEDNHIQVRAWFVIEYIMDLLCIVDFVLNKNYFTFVDHGILVTEKHAIRDHYLHEGTYLVDLFGILPFEILLPLAPLQNAPGTNIKVTWYRVAVFRLNKMVRIAHLHQLGEKLQRMLVYDVKVSFVRPSVIYFVRFAFDFALGAHWVACMFYGSSFNGIDDDYDSWLKAPGMLTFDGRANEHEVGKVSVELKYARSYHFSMGAITTVSYGDVAPLNALETFVVTFIIVISIVLFGMLSGGFHQMFEMELGQRADYEETLASMAHFMLFHEFPTRIWKHMQSYFLVHWSESHGMNEDELLVALPMSVKNDITLYVKHDFVKQMRLFAGCDEAFVRAVVAAFDQELFVRDDVIITYGDRGRSLYVIESGSVLVRVPQSSSAAIATELEVVKGRFDFFGEKSLIFDIPRSATCIALSSCRMLILTVDKYDVIIEQFPEYREKNMCDWIFAHTPDGRNNQALQAIRRLPTAAFARSRRIPPSSTSK